MSEFYRGKKVLVTGGTGLIGKPLVDMLVESNALVTVVSMDDPFRVNSSVEFKKIDLRYFDKCLEIAKGMDIVFHLAGIKGSPLMVKTRPASFFVPMTQFNVNMMEASRQADVSWYLFTSSNGVYNSAEVLYEDDVGKTIPNEVTALSKLVSEIQAGFYKTEYGWNRISIVRPSNVYGPYDNFDPKNAMVIPSLIGRVLSGENPLVVWGDGSAIRDFIHAKDVARGMMLIVERGINIPVNLGSGNGVSIKELVEIILSKLDKKPEVIWDITKPMGDKKRVLDIERVRQFAFVPIISLNDGISEVMKWYKENKGESNTRYNIFSESRK